MAGNVNKVFLMGNLTRDIEIRQAGTSQVASFGMAVNERFKDRDGNWQERANFIDCECWGKRADVLNDYVKKGDALFVEGKLQLDQWDDKKTGEKRSKLKVNVADFQFVGGKGSGSSGNSTPSGGGSSGGGSGSRGEFDQDDPGIPW